MRKLISLVPLLASVVWAQSSPVIAIRNARVVTVSGPVLERGTVVVRNGLISEVSENAAVPSDAWVIEGQGLTVYPGLIDALSSTGIPPPSSSPRAPGSSQQAPPARGPEDRPLTNSWVRAADQIRTDERRLVSLRNLGYTSAITFPPTGIFAGQGAVINLAGENSGQMVVDQRAGQYITFSRNSFSAFPASLMGTIAYIRQVFLDVEHYEKAKSLYASQPQGLERPAYDRALEGLLESPRLLLPAVSEVEIQRMIRFVKELNRPAVLYGGLESYQAADQLAKANVPILVTLKWPEPQRDPDPDAVESVRLLEMREKAPSSPAVLAKAGAKFAFYSDGTEAPVSQVRRAIEAGLTPDQAIRALTLSVAEIYGISDRLGSIEKGKIANLVVTKGDLFVDKPQIQLVVIDGARYEPQLPVAPAKPEAAQ